MSKRIAISIGNTRIASGLLDAGDLRDVRYHLLPDVDAASDAVLALRRGSNVTNVAMSCVVPATGIKMLRRLRQAGVDVFDVSVKTQTVLTGVYPTLGADRLANAAAAYKLYAKKGPAIVLDFGTATTLTAVNEKGEFLGGLITLGLGKTFLSLHQSTAQLPDMQFTQTNGQLSPLEIDTESAITSGCLLAHSGLIEKWVRGARDHLQQPATVIGTGGYASQIRPFTEAIDVFDSLLTVKGVDIIAEAAAGLAGPA